MSNLVVPDPLVFVQGQEPTISCTFRDASGAVIDFTSGYSFTAKVGDSTGTLVTVTAGFTGAATAPNLSIAFPTDALNTISPGNYTLQVRAVNVATSRDRYFQTPLQIRPGLT